MGLDVQLKTYCDLTNARLDALLPSADVRPEPLHAAMRYSCLAPGKRLRPALCLAAAESVGALPTSVLDAGCAIEMIHCFSLIHDDLPALDDDDLRRGVPTCHVKFGEAVAILAGDALFSLAFRTLADGQWDAAAKVQAIRALTQASIDLVRGETADLLGEGKPVDELTLRFIHSNKTGALIAASAEIGARLAGGDDAQCAALHAYGREVGLAFQIADDVLNETATPEQLGKSAGSDRARGKATYPALYGVDASRRRALQAAEDGIAQLAGLPGNLEFLTDVARFSVHRLS